jgi:ATP-dependent DNA helicase RecG
MEYEKMNSIELIELIEAGENSKVELKEDTIHQDSLAQEIVAFANTEGGIIIFGVQDKTNEIIGLAKEKADDLDNKISNLLLDLIKPFLQITTETKIINKHLLLLVEIPKGTNKPYNTKGSIYIRQGSTKRLLSDRDEILRLYQSSGNLYADEMLVENTSSSDISHDKINEYFERQNTKVNNVNERLLENLGVLKNSKLTLGGLLFFGKTPQQFKPVFIVKAVSFFGNSIGGKEYRTTLDIEGTIPEMFDSSLKFFTDNLKFIQKDQNFNSKGVLEISKIALEELVQNAFVHREYLKNSPIRLLIFDNRIEIISPGKLPNSLTIENIKLGNAVARNNLLVSYCSKVMPYRGLGSGITRAFEEQPNLELINDIDGEQFIVRIPRLKFIDRIKFVKDYPELENNILDLFEYPDMDNLQFKTNAIELINELDVPEETKEKLITYLSN